MSNRAVEETTLTAHNSPTNPTKSTSSGQLPCSAVLLLTRNCTLSRNWDWSRDCRMSPYAGNATANRYERRARSDGCLFDRSVTSSSTVSATNSNKGAPGSRSGPIQETSSVAIFSAFVELTSEMTERIRRLNSDEVGC